MYVGLGSWFELADKKAHREIQSNRLVPAIHLGFTRSREKWQQQFEIIGEIRGLGAMLGLELVKGENKQPAADEAKQLVNFCYEKGLVILACGSYGNIIRILAPFVITDEQLERGLAIMEEGLSTLA